MELTNQRQRARKYECESVRSKVVSFEGLSIDESRFDRRQESVQSVSQYTKSVKKYLHVAWQWIKERRIIYICIESQFLSSLTCTLLSKPLLRTHLWFRSNELLIETAFNRTDARKRGKLTDQRQEIYRQPTRR